MTQEERLIMIECKLEVILNELAQQMSKPIGLPSYQNLDILNERITSLYKAKSQYKG